MEQSPSPIADNGGVTGDLLDVLLAGGTITEADAEQARRRQRRAHCPMHEAIMELGTVSQEAIFRAVAAVNSMEYVDLHERKPEEAAIRSVQAKVVLHYKFIPLSLAKGTLTAAFSTPPGVRERQNLRMLGGNRIQAVISSPAEINRAIKHYYGLGAETVMEIRKDRQFQDRVADIQYDNQDLAEDADDNASVIHLFNQIMLEALEMNATDIHVEPFEDKVRLRYRIDGMLREIPTPPGMRDLHSSIVARAKIMANLNIAEHRLPHDGRTRVRIGEEEFLAVVENDAATAFKLLQVVAGYVSN